jgi:hypothetical protein
MGSEEKKLTRCAHRVFGWLAVAVVILGAGPTHQSSHSFDIPAAGRTVCTDGAIFDGEPVGTSSLNLPLTSEVWDGTGTTLLATGNDHTFTAVGQRLTFTVPGTFNVGDTITLTVTDVPGTLGGTEGDAVSATVASCSIAVPTLPTWGLALLALVLLAGGGALLARGPRGRSARPAATS